MDKVNRISVANTTKDIDVPFFILLLAKLYKIYQIAINCPIFREGGTIETRLFYLSL